MEQTKNILSAFTIKSIVSKGNLLELELVDKLNEKTTGIIKNNLDLFTRTYSEGEKIFCKGKLSTFKNKKILNIIYITKQIPLEEDFETPNKTNVDDYVQRFNDIIQNITDKDFREIVENCFYKEIRELFFVYPATEKSNHNYKHGLLQHSVEVVDICLFLADYFDGCDKDLLACAGLLHEIGKLKTFNFEEDKTQKTIWEELLGHGLITSLFVSKMIPEDVDPKKILMLQHLILSKENNSQKSLSKEAFILNKADELSSKINFLDIIKYANGKSEFDEINKCNWYRYGEIKDVD